MKFYLKALLFSLFTTTILTGKNLINLSNTKILKNKKQTQKILLDNNFKKVYFKTLDGIKLCGLFLDQAEYISKPIKGTIILEAGFYPGSKEGIATLYQIMADEPYNFLFFDARGHNESSGSFLNYSGIKKYGSKEYLDIVAAIDFIDEHNQKHNLSRGILLHGICSGAFHAVKAAARANNKELVKGIMFDSGWRNLASIAELTIAAQTNNVLKDSYFSFMIRPIRAITTFLYRLLFKKHHLKIDSIDKDIEELECPIFFIHSTNDPFAPIAPIKEIIKKAKQPSNWWIDYDGHAVSHLKFQKEYTEKFKSFAEKIFTAKDPNPHNPSVIDHKKIMQNKTKKNQQKIKIQN